MHPPDSMIKASIAVPDLEGCGLETLSQHHSAVVLLPFGRSRGALWSLAIYSLVFGDSAPKARYQNSLGQAKAGFGRGAALGKRKKKG